MNYIAISAEEAKKRIETCLPGILDKNARNIMPQIPFGEAPEASREVWLDVICKSTSPLMLNDWKEKINSVLMKGSRAGKFLSLTRVFNVKTLDGLSFDLVFETNLPTESVLLQIPLLSLSEEFVLAGDICEDFYKSLQILTEEFGFEIIPSMTMEQTHVQAHELLNIVEGRNPHVTYILRPKKRLLSKGKIKTRDVFAALLTLGFHWGDEDLFYWPPNSEDPAAIIVTTSSEPGYFLPEDAANGSTISDIIFQAYLPKSVNPILTHEALVTAIEWTSKQLDAEIYGEGNDPYDPKSDHLAIKKIMRELQQHGLPPGSFSATVVF